MIEKYNHIIWDWNGTIINDVELCVDVGNNLFKRKKIPTLTVEKYKSIFTIPVKDYYIAAGFDFKKESFEKIGKEWMEEYEERKYECKLHQGVFELMKKLKNIGIEQSILSAYNQKSLNEMVKYFNIEKFLSFIIGLDNIYAASKLQLGLNLIEKIKKKHNNILMIGDTIHDFEVAKSMGIDCILFTGGHQNKEKLQSCGVPVFDCFNILLNEKHELFTKN